MELSYTEGTPLAFYKKDRLGGLGVSPYGKVNVIHTTNTTSTTPKKIDLDNVATLLEDVIRNTKGRITNKNIEELGLALKNNEPPKNKIMKDIYDDIVNKKGFKSISINEGGVRPTFNKDEERKVIYISGMSGCGKSTFVSLMIENYHKIFPKNRVLFFSNKPSDPQIDKHDFVIRIKLDESIYQDPFTLEDLRDSLIIYDDIEYIKDKEINLELDRLRDLILQQGRSYHISYCYISHQLNNYRQSRIILNETHMCVLFPQMTTTYSLKYLLEKYFGFNKNDIAKLKTLPSRWVAINKMPPAVIHDKGVYMMD